MDAIKVIGKSWAKIAWAGIVLGFGVVNAIDGVKMLANCSSVELNK